MTPKARLAGILTLLLTFAGCAMQPPGDGNDPNGDGPTLAPAQLDGHWMFVPDSDAIPAECYEFDQGTITFYSSFCDGVTDLIEPAAAQIDGSAFSLTFTASLISEAGATVELRGTILDGNTIRIEMTITEVGTTDGLTAPGRLVRNE